MKLAVRFGIGIALILSLCTLLFLVNINDFPLILGAYLAAFICYFIVIQKANKLWFWVIIGLIIRIISLFAFPVLSDDIYRFIWDGWLITEGVNPFSFTPANIGVPIPLYQEFLLEKMNSPDYFSVYPPLLQAIFAGTVWLVPTGAFMQSLVLKLCMLAFETITLFTGIALLKKLHQKPTKILIYFLNPLVIVELMGNLHMELIMISTFALFLYYWHVEKYTAAAIALSFSVAAKLLTILVSPFLIRRIKFSTLLIFAGILSLSLVILFTPMFYATYSNLGKGLNLYFQKFEFNASIYYLLRQVGYSMKGYNTIATLGPSLALISATSILALAWFEKKKSIRSLCSKLTIGLTIYFALSTTVHPWYISLLVFLSVFSTLRYPLYWSFLAILSYAKYYQDAEFYLLCVSIEYLTLLALMIFELRQVKKASPLSMLGGMF